MGHRLIRLVLGEVVGVHIAESLLEEGFTRPRKRSPFCVRGGPTAYYAIGDSHRFDPVRPDARRGNMRNPVAADQQFLPIC